MMSAWRFSMRALDVLFSLVFFFFFLRDELWNIMFVGNRRGVFSPRTDKNDQLPCSSVEPCVGIRLAGLFDHSFLRRIVCVCVR